MNTSEIITFINKQSEILAKSYIKIRYIPQLCSEEEFSKIDFLNYIQSNIDKYLRHFFANPQNLNIDFFNVIFNVKQVGEDFTYSYIHDLPPFKHVNIKKIEPWWTDSKIIFLDNNSVYILQYTSQKLIYNKIENTPNLYTPQGLLNILEEILKPLLDFNYGSDEENSYMRSEILKYIPFNPHINMQYKEKLLIEYWEKKIKNKSNLHMNRCYVFSIKNLIKESLLTHQIDYEEIAEWNSLLQNIIMKITAL